MPMRATAGDLPDVNVWLSLSAPLHIHYAPASVYWQTAAAPRVWFCRHSALGLKRLLGTRSVMNAQMQSTAQCFASWQTWLRLPEVGMLADPPQVDIELDRLAQQTAWPGKMWSDAYLAAFAIAANLRLVSFDRDFARFPGLNWLHLPTEVPA